MKDIIKQELSTSHKVLSNFMVNEINIADIQNAASLMINAIRNGNKIISCGNGGSMSDAMHFASELTGRLKDDRRPFPAIAISDPGHISCVANDYGYDVVFARWIRAHGKEGDVLLAISTSGQSDNVVNAVSAAMQNKMHVVFLSGGNGGFIRELLDIADVEVNVDFFGAASVVQEVHIKIIHILCLLIEKNCL